MPFKLNQFQQNAINEDTNVLVIACPGSGKTRILTLKIAKELELLESRTDRIAALTFTNRAADEIDKRINEMGIDASKLWAGTIHSFCLEWIIKSYGSYLPELQFGYSILDEFSAQDIMDEFKAEYNIPFFQDIITRRDRQGNYLNKESLHNQVAEEYHKYLLENQFIDFDLLLYFSYVLINKYPKIPLNLSKIFKYIFVDEFQDTQDLQYAIVGKIVKAAEGKCKVFFVGDPDQAIFKSLGGIVKKSAEISTEIGGYPVKDMSLNGNYRSTQRIIDLYSNFQSTKLQIESLADYSDEKGEISFDRCIHKSKLAEEISKIIKRELSNGVSPREICVLAPRWNFLTSISRKLKSNLPDIEFDAPGLTVLPRSPENFWFKLARIILIAKDPKNYLTRLKWAKEILEELTALNINVNFDKPGRFLRIVNSIVTQQEDAITFLEESFSYIFKSVDLEYDSNELLLEQWHNFFQGLKRRYESPEFNSIPKDINYMKKMFNSRDGVVVNTCQGVKGEEFHTVIAFGLLRGYVPHWNHIIRQPINNEIEESNKLLYVICSRAKKNLYLFSEIGRTTTTGNSYEINRQLNMVDFSIV